MATPDAFAEDAPLAKLIIHGYVFTTDADGVTIVLPSGVKVWVAIEAMRAYRKHAAQFDDA